MGILLFLFAVVAAAFIFIVAVSLAFMELAGNLINSMFELTIRLGILVVGIVAIVIVWKLLKLGWQEYKKVRKYLKKNKEIEERMRRQAMRN